MNLIEPRQVSPMAWKRWLRESWQLLVHAWPSSVLLAVTLLLASAILLHYTHWFICLLVMVLLAPVLLTLFIANLFRAEGFGSTISQHLKRGAFWWRLCRAGVRSSVFMFLLLLAIGLIMVVFVQSNEADRLTPVLADKMPVTIQYPMLLFGALLLLVVPLAAFYAQSMFPALSSWFLIPILLCFNLTVSDAARLACKADQMNALATNAVLLLSLMGLVLILMSAGVAAVLVLPLIGALHYVSFRDVFFNWMVQQSVQQKDHQLSLDQTCRHT